VRQFAAILVVGDEEVFSGFLEVFPPGRHAMLFAVDEAETIECLDTGEAFLVVMSVAAVSPKLSRALRQSRTKGSVVLGLSTVGSGTMLPDLADWIVPRDHGVPVVSEAARELLEERRRWPRAAIQLPLKMGPAGAATATVVSARSLFVPTPRTLRMGEQVPLELDVEEGEPFSCVATVVRIGRGDSGQRGVVFAVPDEAAAARGYLDRLVRDALRIEHELQGTVVAGTEAVAAEEGGAGPTAPMAAVGADGAVDQDKAESTPLVDQLKGQIWLLEDEAIRHQARLAAALACAAKDREELQKQHDEMEQRMRDLQAALEHAQRQADGTSAADAPAATDGAHAAQPTAGATRPAPLQDRLAALRDRIVKTGTTGPHATVTPEPAPAAAPAAPAAPAARSAATNRTVMGFAAVAGATPETIMAAGAAAAAAAASPAAATPAAATTPAAAAAAAPPHAAGDDVDWDSTMVDRQPFTAAPAPFLAAPAPTAPARAPMAFAPAPVTPAPMPFAPPVVASAPPAPAPTPPFAWPPLAPPPPVAGYPAAPPPAPPYGGQPLAPQAPPYGAYAAPAAGPGGSAAPPPRPVPDFEVPIDEIPRRRPVALYVVGGVGALVVLGLVAFVGLRFLRTSPSARSEVAVAAASATDAAPVPAAPTAPAVPAAATQPADPSTAATAADAAGPTAALAAAASEDASAAPVAAVGADASPAKTAAAAAEAAPADAGPAAVAAGGQVDAAPAPAAKPRVAEADLTAAERRKLKQKERETLLRRGYELIEHNQQDKAREALTRALKMGDDPAVRDLLAMSHRRSGELWSAAHHMEKAAAHSRGAAGARRYVALGALYAQLGKKSDACRAYRAALSALPTYGPAQQQAASCPGGAGPAPKGPPAPARP
jgi:hypothetical protein